MGEYPDIRGSRSSQVSDFEWRIYSYRKLVLDIVAPTSKVLTLAIGN